MSLTSWIDYRRMKQLRKILKQINDLEETYRSMSDEALQAQTAHFKARYQAGETLDDLMIEAFATIREASRRVKGMFHYDVQVLGAIVLFQGKIAEMRTGEGKTLTATMPLYLNALSGKSTILVTTNGYLADRDATEMGEIYEFLGLSVGNFAAYDEKGLDAEEKKELYQKDIVYTTHSGLGFDYLIDNLAANKEKKYMPELDYVIVDEIDAILLDGAQTPLVISGAPKLQSSFYKTCNEFVLSLELGVDYKTDEEMNNVWLTTKGMRQAETYFSQHPLYIEDNQLLIHHILLALKAHLLYKRDKEYVVDDGEVKLLDRQDGRIVQGVKLQSGQHQAIETKEGLKVSKNDRAMATISYQNLFKLFTKIAGMTGTGKVAEEEFIEIYNLEVIPIPTHRPIQRIDYPDKIYPTLPEKLYASLEMVKALHAKGQPIIVATGNVDVSMIYSQLLLREGIAHNVLNAYNVPKEAEIVKEAGQMGSVTVATPIAGRGTDIVLGPGVKELGGLAIIGVEKMVNARIDLQLRGRSGRQGDPGMSQFFISLEDDVIKKNGAKWLLKQYDAYSKKMDYPSPRLLKKRKFQKGVKKAQEVNEVKSRSSRMVSLAFDETIKLQRTLLYKERDQLIELKSVPIHLFIDEALDDYLAATPPESTDQLGRYILDQLSYQFSLQELKNLDVTKQENVKAFLLNLIETELAHKKEILTSNDNIQNFYRACILKAMDEAWINQVDYLQQLRAVTNSRSYAQRDSLREYQKEAYQAFEEMRELIRKNTLENLMLSKVEIDGIENQVSIQFV